ncbi:MAG: hypothetical protein GX594_05420, partial [Pirellulaceae bacterium]|nr:hypothetical protein [Pirellulaceae bacterium]
MSSINANRLFEFLAGIQPMMALFWMGLAVFTVCLAVLLYTRWGQYKPLRKCMALSILVHAMFACYATTIQIIAPLPPRADSIVNVSFVGDAAGDGAGIISADPNERPWEVFSHGAEVHPTDLVLERPVAERPELPERIVRTAAPHLPVKPSLDEMSLDGAAIVEPNEAVGRAVGLTPAAPALEKIAVPPAQRRAPPSAAPSSPVVPDRVEGDHPARPVRIANENFPAELLRQIAASPPATDDEDLELPGTAAGELPQRIAPRPLRDVIAEQAGGGADSAYRGAASTGGQSTSTNPGAANVTLSGEPSAAVEAKPLPEAYRLRVAPDRPNVARGNGGTAETEAAVAAAMKWLADNQDADGRWNPRIHGGGREMRVLGRDRFGAGSRADSAVTGLALLAFLAAGNTHLDGEYRDDVRR